MYTIKIQDDCHDHHEHCNFNNVSYIAYNMVDLHKYIIHFIMQKKNVQCVISPESQWFSQFKMATIYLQISHTNVSGAS